MIYIVRSGDTEFVKIGFAEDVAERVKLLQCGNPKTLHVLRTIEGDRATECWFHRRFRGVRVRSEWFSFTPEMLTVEPPAVGQVRVDTAFDRYLQDAGLSYVEFAGKLGVSAETVRRYAAAERIPRPATMMTIISISGGRLSLGDFVTPAMAARVAA